MHDDEATRFAERSMNEQPQWWAEAGLGQKVEPDPEDFEDARGQ